MTKKNLQEHLFSHEELISLKSFVGQSLNSIYANRSNETYYNESKTMVEVCFKPTLIIGFSSAYYNFSNHIVLNKFNEEICKITFNQYLHDGNPIESNCNKIFDLPLFIIEKIHIFSILNQEFGNDGSSFLNVDNWKKLLQRKNLYSTISDSLIILEGLTGNTMAIATDEFFQGSIRFYSDFNSVNAELMLQTLNDMSTPKYHKRIEISCGKMEYLWQL